MEMKKGDSIRLDDGRLVRVLASCSVKSTDYFSAIVVDDFDDRRGVVTGHFKKRSGVWVRFNPYA